MTAAVNLADVTTTQPYTGISTTSYGHCYRRGGGQPSAVQELRNGSARFVTTGSYRADDGYMGVAVDLDAGKAWTIINGVWTFNQSPVSTPGGTWTFTAGTTLFPAICIQSGIETRTEATHTLNPGDSPFLNVSASAFNAGQVLEGFNPGWFTGTLD